MKLKAIDLAVFLTLIICIIATVNFENTCKGVRDDILRLHIIANSDSEPDQRLKLKVRDGIISQCGGLFNNCDDILSATQSAEDSLSELKDVALTCVENYGYNYDVSVSLCESYFPTKVYENVTLPAGYYNAVKIIIGEGKGKNWWCVMFPSLCLPGALSKESRLSSVLSENEMKLVLSEPEYEVRFWLVEKYYDIKNRFKNNF